MMLAWMRVFVVSLECSHGVRALGVRALWSLYDARMGCVHIGMCVGSLSKTLAWGACTRGACTVVPICCSHGCVYIGVRE